MNAPHHFFTSLGNQLSLRSARAVLSQLGIRSHPLREHLRTLFEQPPGLGGSFIADPVLQAMFGWLPAEKTMQDLAGNLLYPKLVSAMNNPPQHLADEYRFPVDRFPYQHQLTAWEILQQTNPSRSVLVSSGTGSGKTECFLVPILDELAREAERGTLTGVRALFLYPLNALINSQRDRLRAWSSPFQGRIRFCLYNGDTPEEVKSHIQRAHPEEVLSRKLLRENPPPILVTNATMLEYMLVRNRDAPILQASQGKLRWIVLDEAHTYIGSQAAELALLLRRVLHAFGTEADQVRFVATSATIASDSDDVNNTDPLRQFLADIAGVDVSRVSVIRGQRLIPELNAELARRQNELPDQDMLQSLDSAALYETLASHPGTRAMRNALIKREQSLSALARGLFHQDGPQERLDTLQLLDLCSRAQMGDQSFLSLRGHFFHRTQNGLWACANADCMGRHGTELNDSLWSFGKVFLERREHCDACGSPVYELVLCNDCGSEYLAASEVLEKGITVNSVRHGYCLT